MRLDLDRALRIGEPVFGDMAERLDHVGDLVGWLDLDRAVLARLEVGGERLAAFLDHARDVLREALDIDGADLAGGLPRSWPAPLDGVAVVSATAFRPRAAFVLRTLVLGFVILFGINLFEAILPIL